MNIIKKIVIAIDNGPTSEKVALNGFELGKQLNAELAIVSVVDTSNLMTEGSVTPGELAKIIKNDYKINHQILIEKVFKEFKVWAFVEEGKPFEAILKVSKEWDADLIVIGTHGRTGITHLLMGSVAEKVVRHSTKPVLIIPTK